METKQFTLNELEKMLSDHIACHLGKHDETCIQNGRVLIQNTINIANQLLSILSSQAITEVKTDHVSAKELETMLSDHKTYWNDRLGRGDIEAENADLLPGKIIWITEQLIEVMRR
jgi:hypothetical protein